MAAGGSGRGPRGPLAGGATADPDLRLTLDVALTRLSVPLREAFLMRHLAGYSYEEIAALTATTPHALKMRVHLAREAQHTFLLGEEITSAG